MKKALVYVKEIDGRTVGQVAMMREASVLDNWRHQHLAFAERVVVPADLEDIPESELEGVLVLASPEHWSNGTDTVATYNDIPTVDDGEGNQIPDPAYNLVPAVQEHWTIQKADSYIQYDKDHRVGEKFAALNKAVEEQMKTVYNTTNPDSAVANYLTWLSMKNDPARFSDKNLVARFAVTGATAETSFALGDALDTDQKVTDYSTALIAAADDYAIWREQQILVYVAEKTAIENE